jgi:hypothetical protein
VGHLMDGEIWKIPTDKRTTFLSLQIGTHSFEYVGFYVPIGVMKSSIFWDVN